LAKEKIRSFSEDWSTATCLKLEISSAARFRFQ
jgi:hypothetical protein